ncbi:MAG TPA: hypothetical protein VFT22_20615 [Kofleriaceae bacterium]|nr:hypothetical protein [Kofleriaceae bacterium]
MRIVIGVLAGWVLVACAHGGSGRAGGDDDGSGGGGPGGGGPGGSDGSDAGLVTGTLTISPPASELVIANGAAVHATYTATLTANDGTSRDVTASTEFLVDGNAGSFVGNQLTIGTAARTRVIAYHGGLMATSDLIARIKDVRIDPSLLPTVPALFASPEAAELAPQIVYPADGAVMPRNLGDFEIHWTDANSNDVFEISLRTDLSDVRVYVPGGNGALGPTTSWSAFQAQEWADAVGSESEVSYQVRGVNRAAPGVVHALPARKVQLSNEVMDGALYYWGAVVTAGSSGIFRHDMRRPGEPAEAFLTTPAGGRCIACHVLSRDGTKMAVTYDTAVDGPATLLDVATKAAQPETAWNFGTFTPDSAQFLSVEHGVLVVRDAATQAVLATMTTTPAKAWVTQPDLSPDGKQLAYVRPILSGDDVKFKQGEIWVRDYDAATHTFGAERLLVAGTTSSNFYPAWSPDGAWIAFTRAPVGDFSYDDNNSSGWVVRADGSQPPIELAAANAGQPNEGTRLTNSAIRWAPFAQTLGAAKEPMFWLTMPSKRDFGVRLKNANLAQLARTAQLWMTPFFPGRAAAGNDPSAPAFRLPFQDLATSNHAAQWTERIVVLQ